MNPQDEKTLKLPLKGGTRWQKKQNDITFPILEQTSLMPIT